MSEKNKLHVALRVALTGKDTSPSVVDMMMVLGKEKTLKRIERCMTMYLDSAYLDSVYKLADKWHTGQTRSNGIPYIMHPIDVLKCLWYRGISDEIVLATALCHDLLEDTQITEEELSRVAGPEVLEAVKQLTNKVPQGTPFKEKTERMLEHAKTYNDVAKRVKLADRYCNVYDSIGEWEPARVKRYAAAGLQLLDAMQPLPNDVKSLEDKATKLFCLYGLD